MKRTVILPLVAALLVSCEKPTGPALPRPSSDFAPGTPTTFSGEATVARISALGLALEVVKAGPLPPSGGADDTMLVSISGNETGGVLAAEVAHASVVGQGDRSSSAASVAGVNLTAAGNSIQAVFLRSQAEATCDGAGGASAAGSSEITGLTVNGGTIDVSGQPNQTVSVGGVTIVINEQSGSASGNQAEITVNALHVTAVEPVTGQLVDVVIASAHADISCGRACTPPAGDFVTGGGWITGTPSGSRANFAVAGGMKTNGLWGHLTFIDHGNGLKVKGTSVTAYTVTGPLSRRIEGTADVAGEGSVTYVVDVTDNGEPGRADTFSLSLSNGYFASGPLAGGNIQLHVKPGPCP